MAKTLKKEKSGKNGYSITAYCPIRDKTFSWVVGKRGLGYMTKLIRAERLIGIKIKGI